MLILYAILNGLFVGLARTFNGRLAGHHNPLYASWMNHLIGFLFLTAIIFLTTGFSAPASTIPSYLYLGGIIGALYVTLNAFIVNRLGITQSTLLVIAGQLLMSVILDLMLGKIKMSFSFPMLLLAVGGLLLIYGFYQSLKTK